jgi:methyltransferase (TIGR00027 family)
VTESDVPATTGTSTIGAVAKTALWTAASRARESRRTDRLFDDPLAALLAGDEGPDLLSHFHTRHAAEDGNPFLPIRTRWFDDFLTAPDGPEVHQVVGLGAGLDTRAVRLDWPAGTVLFEIDQADLLAYKEDRLHRSGLSARCDRRTVPVDLGKDWTSALLGAGYRPELPSVWFAEGVLFYLPAELARRVVQEASALCAPGTRFAADLIGTGVFTFPYTREFLARLAAAGSPWQFGTDDPAGFLTSCGWEVDAVLEPGFPGANYGRWPEQANPGGVVGLPRSYLAASHRR